MHPKTTYKQLVDLVTILAGVPVNGHATAALQALSDRARELLGEAPRGDMSYDARTDQYVIRIDANVTHRSNHVGRNQTNTLTGK